jgi:hypothetical protein
MYTCTSSSPAHSKKLVAIAQALNLDVQHFNDSTLRVRLPIKCITLKVPRQAPTLTAEQITARDERLRRLHPKKGAQKCL